MKVSAIHRPSCSTRLPILHTGAALPRLSRGLAVVMPIAELMKMPVQH